MAKSETRSDVILVSYSAIELSLATINFGRRHGTTVIENCRHTFRTKLNKKLVGEIGDAAFYSLEREPPCPVGAGGALP